jgi:plastocyanin
MQRLSVQRSGYPVPVAQAAFLRNRMLLSLAVLSTVAFLIVALKTTIARSATQPPVLVKMIDMPPSFEPTQVTIKAGESVEWQNTGNEVHHATNDPALAIKRPEVTNPPGVQPFDSGFLRPGETFTHTFLKPGIYKYTCVVHEMKGMTGEVIVK